MRALKFAEILIGTFVTKYNPRTIEDKDLTK